MHDLTPSGSRSLPLGEPNTEAGTNPARVLMGNLLKLLVSVFVSLTLYVLVGDIVGAAEFDVLDIGSTIWLTGVLYVLFLPGAALHLAALRRLGSSRSLRVRRLLAVAASPLVAMVFFVLVAAEPESDVWPTSLAVVGAAAVFGIIVSLPANRQPHPRRR
jgi:peptidoglycan/LPS O-acetylase OafA/YrhL